MEFKEVVEKRYATKLFSGEKLPQEKVDELLEMIRLSASSFGLQPFVVQVVSNQELKEKLQEASFGQPQVSTASHVLVFCATEKVSERIDEYEKIMLAAGRDQDTVSHYVSRMRGHIESMSKENLIFWGQKQTYIAMSNAINGAKALGFDSCPMEGIDKAQYKEILGLPDYLHVTVAVPIGVAADEPKPKLRFPKESLFEYKD